jgi:DNA-binding CsgD family transcriptional regulator
VEIERVKMEKVQELWRFLDKAREVADCAGLLFGRTQRERVAAAEELFERYQPYPYKQQARGVLKFLFSPDARRNRKDNWQRLHDLWIEELLRGAKTLARDRRTWRFKRKWLKDGAGRRAEISLDDLDLDLIPRAVKTLCINVYQRVLINESGRLGEIQNMDLLQALKAEDCTDREIFDRIHEPQLELSETTPVEDLRRRRRAAQLKPKLSPREREVFRLLCRDFAREKIARQLNLNPTTLRVHIHNIKIKATRSA